MGDATRGNEHAQGREIERKSLAGVGGLSILGQSRDQDRTGFHAEIFLPPDEFVSNGK